MLKVRWNRKREQEDTLSVTITCLGRQRSNTVGTQLCHYSFSVYHVISGDLLRKQEKYNYRSVDASYHCPLCFHMQAHVDRSATEGLNPVKFYDRPEAMNSGP